jgi:Uma2 family endonuclease
MATVEQSIPLLVAGDNLPRDEFLRRWEATPQVRRAELIGGVVYVPSPLSWPHGTMDNHVGTWLGVYAASTPGCEAGNNATWLMLQDAPQPDISLRLLPECGGKSRLQGRYVTGAPEFLAEICLSSTAYDLHQKLNLYRTAGVNEYLAVLLREQELRWHRLVGDTYELVPVAGDGVLRSVIFPGLWLHAQALLEGDMAQVLTTLNHGLTEPGHAAFVAELTRKRSGAS